MRAEAFRDGLMFAFLAARPLRLKNMIELKLGEHLMRERDGYQVSLPADVTKTHAHLEFPVPSGLVPYMRQYLDVYRPVLAAGAASGQAHMASDVWLSRSGTRLSSDIFADRIAAATMAGFGTRLTPHRFRDCAATTIAQNDPEEFHIIRVILGHTTIVTAERHYIHANGVRAAQLVQETIAEKRKALKQQIRSPDHRDRTRTLHD